MDDKQYLDRDGLKNYDTLIKKYVRVQIANAITAYEARDNIEIEEFIPEGESNDNN